MPQLKTQTEIEKDKQQKLQSPFSFRRQTTVQREAAAYDDK